MLVEHLVARSPLIKLEDRGVLYAHQQEDYIRVNTTANDKQDVGFCSSWFCFLALQQADRCRCTVLVLIRLVLETLKCTLHCLALTFTLAALESKIGRQQEGQLWYCKCVC